jgi:hypothetical protein
MKHPVKRVTIQVDPHELMKIAADFLERYDNSQEIHKIAQTKLKGLTFMFKEGDTWIEFHWIFKRNKSGKLIKTPVVYDSKKSRFLGVIKFEPRE